MSGIASVEEDEEGSEVGWDSLKDLEAPRNDGTRFLFPGGSTKSGFSCSPASGGEVGTMTVGGPWGSGSDSDPVAGAFSKVS